MTSAVGHFVAVPQAALTTVSRGWTITLPLSARTAVALGSFAGVSALRPLGPLPPATVNCNSIKLFLSTIGESNLIDESLLAAHCATRLCRAVNLGLRMKESLERTRLSATPQVAQAHLSRQEMMDWHVRLKNACATRSREIVSSRDRNEKSNHIKIQFHKLKEENAFWSRVKGSWL